MHYYRIHLTKLPKECTKQDIISYFSRFGKIFSGKVGLDKNKVSKGYGKITIPHKSTFDLIMSQEHWIKEQKIHLEPFLVGSRLKKKELKQIQRKIAVFNLTDSMDKPYLLELFSIFGTVEDCLLKTKNNEKYAFVTFEKEESAKILKNKEFLQVIPPGQAFGPSQEPEVILYIRPFTKKDNKHQINESNSSLNWDIHKPRNDLQQIKLAPHYNSSSMSNDPKQIGKRFKEEELIPDIKNKHRYTPNVKYDHKNHHSPYQSLISSQTYNPAYSGSSYPYKKFHHVNILQNHRNYQFNSHLYREPYSPIKSQTRFISKNREQYHRNSGNSFFSSEWGRKSQPVSLPTQRTEEQVYEQPTPQTQDIILTKVKLPRIPLHWERQRELRTMTTDELSQHQRGVYQMHTVHSWLNKKIIALYDYYEISNFDCSFQVFHQ